MGEVADIGKYLQLWGGLQTPQRWLGEKKQNVTGSNGVGSYKYPAEINWGSPCEAAGLGSDSASSLWMRNFWLLLLTAGGFLARGKPWYQLLEISVSLFSDSFYSRAVLLVPSLLVPESRGTTQPQTRDLGGRFETNTVRAQVCVSGVGANPTSRSSLSLTLNNTWQFTIGMYLFINRPWGLSSEVLMCGWAWLNRRSVSRSSLQMCFFTLWRYKMLVYH